MISQSELKRVLRYDLNSGKFFWLRVNKKATKIKVGDEAGYIQNGYITITVNGSRYKAHRLAWFYVYGEWPYIIDHKNHIRSDNRISNLSNTDYTGNSRNKKIDKRNKSGVTGVSYHKSKMKWEVHISICGSQVYIGSFDGKFEACCIRKSLETKHGYHENHGK